jgi:tetratricopeptide (TPR) repeat protein
MAAVAREADAHNRRGYELANRGALFSARAEFLQSLRLLAEGLDAETHCNEYARSLAAGLRALDEADDFSQRSTRLDREVSLAALIRAHSTTVLKDQPLDTMTLPEAIAQYHEFAAEHLAASVGGETAGSLALHALGKAQAEFTRLKTSSVVDPQLKLLVFERAALLVDPNNYLASNDLGVALADRGELVEARNLLARAARLCPQPQIWHNLSVIHARLGEAALAESADAMAMQASGGANPANLAALQSVRWVDQAAFHQLSPPPTDLNPAPPADAKPAGPQQPPRRAMPAWLQWGSKQP